MSIFDKIGNWFKKEEKIIATDLAPLAAAVKADLQNAGHTLESFLKQDGAEILGTALATLTASVATGGIGAITTAAVGAAFTGALAGVKATAIKQGVNLAETTATAIAANVVAQAQGMASGSANTKATNTAK